MGRLLNIHAEMAHAPVVLAAYQGIQQAITKHGSFGPRPGRRSRWPWPQWTSAPTA
jgi:hypothetical protein